MSGLQPDERRLLDDYVAAKTPDVSRALAATLARIEHGPAPVLPDLPPARSATPWTRVAMFAIAAAAIVVIAWRGFDLLELSQRDDVHEIAPAVIEPQVDEGDATVRGDRVPRAASERADRPAVDPPAEAAASENADNPAALPIERSPSASKSRTRGTPDLAAELALLRDADAALDAGNAKQALALLDRHAREYPRGQMVPERLLQKAIALCKLGKRDKSRAQIDKLLRAYPTTPLRARASDVCKADAQP
ncbi:MAG TPA: hypothetical protein VG755_16795 [Nannocystaceae bacterium]|nr:hypothetical protein [Nannocystaceae bacterium]